jgi:hypothetical protein
MGIRIVISQPGCHSPYLPILTSFLLEKTISTYAKKFCNKQKAIRLQKEKNQIDISLLQVPVGLPKYKTILF